MSSPRDFIYISTMLELADWRPEDIEIQASKASNTPLLQRPPPLPTSPLPGRPPTTPPPIPNLLSCHDYKGGYHPSESAQGQFPAPPKPIYTAAHLHLIDTFVYFSHNLVSIPPSPWINTLHRNGVRVLGTFIVEHNAGSTALSRLLDKGSEGEYVFATQLALIAETYGFDGWLMNIEASFPGEDFKPGELQAFLKELRSALVELVPGGQVIWYDALTVLNQVHWQNGLTLLNAPFFGVTDGLFTNYGWREPQLEATRIMSDAMNRVPDIYTGIDCFGRGSLGGGGFGIAQALSAIRKVGTSAALFAPGWTYEHFEGRNFETVDRRFWVGDGDDVDGDPVKPISYFVSEKVCGGSEFFFTNFNRGFGKGWWIDGVKVMDTPWVHMGVQSILPSKHPRNTDKLKWSFTEETAYFGGTGLNISTAPGIVAGGAVFCPLYSTNITANGSSIQVAYLLPEQSPAEILEGEVVGVYYASNTTQTQTLLPLPQTRGSWRTTTFPSITADPNEKIIELGVYYKHLSTLAAPGYKVLTLGNLHMSPVPTVPERPSRITDVLSTLKEGGSTKLSWEAYKRDFSPAMEKLRSVPGCFSRRTGDFASFLVWRGEELVGVSFCLEYDVPAGVVVGDWRVDGVMWGGGIVRGGGGS